MTSNQQMVGRRLICQRCGNSQHKSVFRKNAIVFAVLLKTTSGTFEDYRLGDDLHIGLFNGQTSVLSFGAFGVVLESKSDWNTSIEVLRAITDDENELLDSLRLHLKWERFSRENYSPERWNCFDFVIESLVALSVLGGCSCSLESVKEKFVTDFIYNPLLKRIDRSNKLH